MCPTTLRRRGMCVAFRFPAGQWVVRWRVTGHQKRDASRSKPRLVSSKRRSPGSWPATDELRARKLQTSSRSCALILNNSLVTTFSTVPDVRSGLSRASAIWLRKFCTANNWSPFSRMPSTNGTLAAHDRGAGAGHRLDGVQRALPAVRDDQRLAIRRGLDAVVVEVAGGVRRRRCAARADRRLATPRARTRPWDVRGRRQRSGAVVRRARRLPSLEEPPCRTSEAAPGCASTPVRSSCLAVPLWPLGLPTQRSPRSRSRSVHRAARVSRASPPAQVCARACKACRP